MIQIFYGGMFVSSLLCTAVYIYVWHKHYDVNFTMIVSLVSMWTFRIIMSYVLGSWLGMGVFGVWVAMTIDWLFRAAAFIWRYRGHKWENQKV